MHGYSHWQHCHLQCPPHLGTFIFKQGADVALFSGCQTFQIGLTMKTTARSHTSCIPLMYNPFAMVD